APRKDRRESEPGHTCRIVESTQRGGRGGSEWIGRAVDDSGTPAGEPTTDGAAEAGDADRTEEDPLALRIEQLILGAPRQYTPFQAARAADVPMEMAARFWRAMGFADIGQARALTEADVLALR